MGGNSKMYKRYLFLVLTLILLINPISISAYYKVWDNDFDGQVDACLYSTDAGPVEYFDGSYTYNICLSEDECLIDGQVRYGDVCRLYPRQEVQAEPLILSDFNNDGVVNLDDFFMFADGFGFITGE